MSGLGLPSSRKQDFPGGSDGQRICLQCRTAGFNPWVGKIPWERKWQPTPVFLPGESHGQRGLEGYSLWICKELDTTERLTSTWCLCGSHTTPSTHLLETDLVYRLLYLGNSPQSNWRHAQLRVWPKVTVLAAVGQRGGLWPRNQTLCGLGLGAALCLSPACASGRSHDL